MRATGLRGSAVPFAILLALVFVAFWKVLLGGVNLPIDVLYEETYPWKFQMPGVRAHILNNRDPMAIEYPLQSFVTATVREFRLPLWNPYVLGGAPELATGIFGVFYPLNVVYYVLPGMWAINADVMLHVFLAGWFMYLYVAFVARSAFGGIVAGVSFMFSGILTLYYPLYPVYHVIVWLPLALLCVEKLLRDQRPWRAGALGAVIAVQFLAGQMEYIFYCLLATAIYFILRGVAIVRTTRTVRALRRPLGLALLGVGIGIALGGVQLIPTLELIPLSQRVFRPYQELIPLGRSSWLGVLTAINPNVFGSFVDRNWFGPGYPSTSMVYIGVPSLLLLLVGILLRREPPAVALLGVGVVAWLIALGTPLVYLLYHVVPGFSGLRQVGRAIYLLTIVGAAVAGLGASVFEEGATVTTKRRLGRFVTVASVLWAGTAMGLVFLLSMKARLVPMAMEFLVKHAREKGWLLTKSAAHYGEQVSRILSHEFWYGAMFLVMSGIALALIAVRMRERLSLTGFKVAFVALAVVDLLRFPLGYAHVVDAGRFPLYPVSESVAFLKRDREPFRVLSLLSCGGSQAFPPNTLMPYGIEAVQAYNSFLPGRMGQFVRQLDGGDGGCGGAQHQNLVMPGRLANDGMSRLLNVKYVVTPPDREPLEEAHLRLVFDGEVRIYRNVDYLPRAFWVPSARWAAGDAEVLAELRSPTFDPRNSVVLEGPATVTDTTSEPGPRAPADVRVEEYDGSRVKIAVQSPAAGWLVLLDNHFPGWKALVDGRPATLYRANFTFRAVRVSAGRHEVEFRYRPVSFVLGALLTGGAVLGSAVILTYDRRKGRGSAA